MNFRSTRTPEHEAPIEDVLRRGLAPDGGLYVPTRWPTFAPEDFSGHDPAVVAETLLGPFFADSPLAPRLPAICQRALSFPMPAKPLDERAWVLELFHGPTCAFKDVGARFLAACLEALAREDDAQTVVLTATSGDTGAAVAAAFEGMDRAGAAVLFPQTGVSPRQRHQLTCWDQPIESFALDGPFDLCQALVKEAFVDPVLRDALQLTSANSISVGRLLPQMSYYAATALALHAQAGEKPGFIVPTGNLGNALACVWARSLGLPIGDVILATNDNRTITRFLASGEWAPRPTVATLASAMDVGNPSNMERLRHQYPDADAVNAQVAAVSVDDAAIREAIVAADAAHGEVLCPHTATAYHVWQQLPPPERARPWVLVATAHPAKFEQIVEPLIGRAVAVPEPLAELLARPTREHALGGNLPALRDALLSAFGGA
ncbi:MAG: threonine synthase [Pseudomonadota bacterium]